MKTKKTTKNVRPSLLAEEITVVTPWLLVTLLVVVALFTVMQYIV